MTALQLQPESFRCNNRARNLCDSPLQAPHTVLASKLATRRFKLSGTDSPGACLAEGMRRAGFQLVR
eukprot:5188409-Amphidinium_carterae.2